MLSKQFKTKVEDEDENDRDPYKAYKMQSYHSAFGGKYKKVEVKRPMSQSAAGPNNNNLKELDDRIMKN